MRLINKVIFICLSISFFSISQPWQPDLGNGRYKNPVIFADYSDPDIIRVDDDFYMISSSFNCIPGIPVLHSKDLINWTIIGHVYERLPLQKYDKPVHGQGSWAPSIRYHNNTFYVYFCTPHDGLFVATAKNSAGPWQLEYIVDVELWEDPCPFWDEHGNAFLVRSKLRADVLYLHKMSKDGKKILDNGTIIFQDIINQPKVWMGKNTSQSVMNLKHSQAHGLVQKWDYLILIPICRKIPVLPILTGSDFLSKNLLKNIKF